MKVYYFAFIAVSLFFISCVPQLIKVIQENDPSTLRTYGDPLGLIAHKPATAVAHVKLALLNDVILKSYPDLHLKVNYDTLKNRYPVYQNNQFTGNYIDVEGYDVEFVLLLPNDSAITRMRWTSKIPQFATQSVYEVTILAANLLDNIVTNCSEMDFIKLAKSDIAELRLVAARHIENEAILDSLAISEKDPEILRYVFEKIKNEEILTRIIINAPKNLIHHNLVGYIHDPKLLKRIADEANESQYRDLAKNMLLKNRIK